MKADAWIGDGMGKCREGEKEKQHAAKRACDVLIENSSWSLCYILWPLLYHTWYITSTVIHRVSKNVPPLACYNFDTHECILILYGKNVTDKVDNQKLLYYATSSSNNLCFCTTWQNGETRTSHFFTQLNCVTRTMHMCAVFLKERIVICDVFDSVYRICWHSKISH